MAALNLIERVQSLPPELYNQIYEFTFSLEALTCGERIRVDKSYKPPSILQVSREQRCELFQAFYEYTIFCFTDDPTCHNNLEELTFWLKSLPITHRKVLNAANIRIVSTIQVPSDIANLREQYKDEDLKTILRMYRRVENALAYAGYDTRKFRRLRFQFAAPDGSSEPLRRQE